MLTRTDAGLRLLALSLVVTASPLLRADVADVIFADGFEIPGSIVINEISSNPLDWIELFNVGGTPVDIGGWYVSDSDPTHIDAFPAGTMVPAHGYIVFFPATFGLGSVDAAILHDSSSAVVDQYSWGAHPAGTYSRCPNGSGPFLDVVATQGAENINCP